MMLTRYQSPFVTGERQPQFGDLCFAIWVCKRDWEELMQGVRDNSLTKEVRFLGWVSKFRNKNKAMLIFVEYLTKATTEPDLFFNKTKDQKPASMNHLHYMKILLMNKLRMSKQQAIDMPFGEAVYDVAAIGESEGACGFVTDDHSNAGESAKRQWEKRQAEKVEQNGKRN